MKTRAFRIWLAAAAGAALIFSAVAQEKKPARPYTVGGTRHGVSYFPRVDYEATRPKAKGQLDFAHYHTYDEAVAFLRAWERDYPNLVSLYSAGQSFEGREIWQITITNKARWTPRRSTSGSRTTPTAPSST